MTINELIAEYGAYIFNYAWKISCSPEDAEDISQETFVQAWKHLDTLRNEAAVKGWLRQICLNCFLMKYRKKDTANLVFTDDESVLEKETDYHAAGHMPLPEEEVLVDESVREMQNGCFYAMVRRLSLNQRMAFSLVDMFGLSVQEAAAMLSVTEGAVKALLFRARMNLDAFFSDHCSVIRSANPCSCKAWQDFWLRRETNREQMQAAIQIKKFQKELDWHEKNYHFSAEVRAKIKYLYAHMPDKEPDEKWFKKIIQTVSSGNQAASSLREH